MDILLCSCIQKNALLLRTEIITTMGLMSCSGAENDTANHANVGKFVGGVGTTIRDEMNNKRLNDFNSLGFPW